MADVMGAVFQDLVTRCMTTFVNLDIRQTKGPLCYLRPGSKPFFCRTFSRNAETHSLSTDGYAYSSFTISVFSIFIHCLCQSSSYPLLYILLMFLCLAVGFVLEVLYISSSERICSLFGVVFSIIACVMEHMKRGWEKPSFIEQSRPVWICACMCACRMKCLKIKCCHFISTEQNSLALV